MRILGLVVMVLCVAVGIRKIVVCHSSASMLLWQVFLVHLTVPKDLGATAKGAERVLSVLITVAVAHPTKMTPLIGV